MAIDGAEQLKDRGLAGGAGRVRRRVDPHRDQGDGVLPAAVRRCVPLDARRVSRDVPAGRAAFHAPLRAPDEILAKDEGGNYIQDAQGILQWVPETGEAMRNLVSRGWMTVENQAPIIKGINDDADALRILQREFKRVGGENHYFFCGRDIVAYRAFNVPIETAWMTLNESQKGLSGIENHARLSITHYKGKTEVNAGHERAHPRVARERERRGDLQDPAQRAQRAGPGKGVHRRAQPRCALVR